MCGEIEVSFQIGGIDNGHDHIRFFIQDKIASHYFFDGIWREAVSARQINDNNIVSVVIQVTLFFFNGHPRPISNLLSCAGEIVKDRGLAGVGISCKRHGESLFRHYVWFPCTFFTTIWLASHTRSEIW